MPIPKETAHDVHAAARHPSARSRSGPTRHDRRPRPPSSSATSAACPGSTASRSCPTCTSARARPSARSSRCGRRSRPAAVGVDIGCGMSAVRTNLTAADLPDDLGALRSAIEATIPVGFNAHDEPDRRRGRVHGLPTAGWDAFWAGFGDLHARRRRAARRGPMRQMGTLGGGNHFIEVCLEQGGTDAGRVWLMLHSGSRNIGKELAERHIGVARRLPHNADLPDRDLAVFVSGTPEMDAYRRDLTWAQEYAARNRARHARAAVPRGPATRFPHVTVRRADLVPPQLRGRGDVRRRRPAGDPQGRDPGRRRRPGHHPGLDGHRLVHRARPRQRGGVLLGVARRRPADVAGEGEADVHGRRTWPRRPPASSAARTPAWSTRSPAPTRTWTR